MAMHDLNFFPQNNISEYGEEGEDGGEGGFAVDDEKGDMVDFETVGQVAHAGSAGVGVGDDDDFVAAVDEFGGELVDVGFDAAGLGEEEVADHGDVVRHFWRLRCGYPVLYVYIS